MKNSKNIENAIEVHNLRKSFRIPLDGGSTLKQRIVHFLKRQKGYRVFSPLNGVSFEVKKGEFFGIVGRNGSGKSTLLKTIAGIYAPDKGGIHVQGTLVPFIELGVGFNPELTGRENVYLNGALLGFSRAEMSEMYEEIVDFAELHEFMDERLKNYSSGMQVRLAFAIAIRAKGDVLLLDEVLAVGDQAFQQKCYDYFGQLKQNNQTVVLVTHSMSAVERFCDRGILIDGGKVIAEGDSFEISEKYQDIFLREKVSKPTVAANNDTSTENIILDNVSIVQDGDTKDDIKAGKEFSVVVEYTAPEKIGDAACGINIVNSMGGIMLATGTGGIHDDTLRIPKGKSAIKFTIKQNIFTNDSYIVNVAFTKGNKKSFQELIFQKKRVASFRIYGVMNRPHSLTHPNVSVEVLK